MNIQWDDWQDRLVLVGVIGLAGTRDAHVLLSVTPVGVITGFGLGPVSTYDQQLATTLFTVRKLPSPRLLSPGLPAQGSYVADKDFAGEQPRHRWQAQHQVDLVTPAHQRGKPARWCWLKALRRWLASIRQIIETVNDKFLNTFRLAREGPHDLTGFQARLAAKVGLLTFCIWRNRQLSRAALTFVDLIDW